MSRLSFDHLASLLPTESALAPLGSSSADRGEGSFRDLLQRAQNTANPPDSDRPAKDPSRGTEADRSRDPSRPPSRDPPTDGASAPPDRPAEKPDRPTADTEDNGEGADEEAAIAEAGANADDDDRDQGNEDSEADALAVVAPPEANPVLADEWIPTADPAAAQAIDQGQPSSPVDSQQPEGALPLASQQVEEAQQQPLSGGGQAVGLPGEVAGGKQKPPAHELAKAGGERPTESVSTSASDENPAQDAMGSLDAGQPTGQDTGQTVEAAGAAQTPEGSQSQERTSRRRGRRDVGNVPAPDAQAATVSEALDQPPVTKKLDTAAPVLSIELASPSTEQKTEAADAASKTAAPEAGRNEAAPPVRNATIAESATGSSGDGDTAPAAEQLDRVRFVQRVSRAFESLGDRGGSLRLRLHPPELGSLRLEMTVRNGAMTARVEAETPAARNLLLDNLPALRERLAEQQIKVERFDVDLADHSAGGTWQQPQDQSSPQGQQAEGDSRRRGRRETAVDTAAAASTAPRYGDGSGFDVTI